jgi:hypothetical protein
MLKLLFCDVIVVAVVAGNGLGVDLLCTNDTFPIGKLLRVTDASKMGPFQTILTILVKNHTEKVFNHILCNWLLT